MAVFIESAVVPTWYEPNLSKYLELLLYFDGCVWGGGVVSYLPLGNMNIYCKPVVSLDETGKINISLQDILGQK